MEIPNISPDLIITQYYVGREAHKCVILAKKDLLPRIYVLSRISAVQHNCLYSVEKPIFITGTLCLSLNGAHKFGV